MAAPGASMPPPQLSEAWYNGVVQRQFKSTVQIQGEALVSVVSLTRLVLGPVQDAYSANELWHEVPGTNGRYAVRLYSKGVRSLVPKPCLIAVSS